MDARISQANFTKQYVQKGELTNTTKLSTSSSKKPKPESKNLAANTISSPESPANHWSSIPENLVDTFTETTSKELSIPNNSIQTSYQNKTAIVTDIENIENFFKKTNDKTVLPWLIKKLLKDYKFDEAYNYFNMMDSYDQKSDPKLHLYLLINQSSVNIANLDSIQSILPVLNSYKSDWIISDSDYNFYQWLIQIRNGKYDEAQKLFQNNIDTDQQKFIKNFQKSETDYSNTKDAPEYYLDWLISLDLMKNWYFTIAKKVALDALSQNEKYILPYQVLAYTNFITNNTEVAADYFLRLSEFDLANQDSYKFLIWISYFRAKKYSESILYLSQVTNEKVLTDTYRYLVLAYEKIWDIENISRYQQKLLWQSDITNTDFYTYFYQSSYSPYSLWKNFDIYNQNQQLYILFLQKCELSSFTGVEKDICEYWKLWFDVLQWTLDSQDSETIQNLANRYPQSYFYQVLWDISFKNLDIDQAKVYYTKADKLASDFIEKEVIKNKLINLSNQEKPLFSQK